MIRPPPKSTLFPSTPLFRSFGGALVELVEKKNPADVTALAALRLGASTVEEARKALVGRIGENMSIRRFARIEAKGRLSHYVHGGGKIGGRVENFGGEGQCARAVGSRMF